MYSKMIKKQREREKEQWKTERDSRKGQASSVDREREGRRGDDAPTRGKDMEGEKRVREAGME